MNYFPAPILVVAAVLAREDGRVLLQQRRFGGRLSGLWEFPGGKVEPGESLESALRREIAEELGVGLSAHALAPAAFSSDPNPDPHERDPHVILLYTCTAWAGEPQGLAAEAIGWFTPSAATALELPPLDVPLVAALERIVADAVAGRGAGPGR